MSGIKIYTLPSVGQAAPEDSGSSLKEEIEAGLLGTEEVIVPGDTDEDKLWSYTRSVPTVTLYDETGLRLYDEITAKAKEYYLFDDELELLITHGGAIARAMGFPRAPKDDAPRHQQHGPLKRWRPARWGDTEVGKWNDGVNGEEGLAGGFDHGWDIVELGAGALRKTAYLLTALSASVDGSTDWPITYHPLDLSFPELQRVLGEMEESFGPQLKDKVNCIGLHGDYEAGLQFIRDGRLPSLRHAMAKRQQSPALANPAVEMVIKLEPQEGSPISSASDALVTPGPDSSTMSEMTITDASSGVDDSRSGGTWSPVESEDPPLPSPPGKHTTLPSEDTPNRPLHFMFLGSSIGNFSRESAGPFLASLPLRQGDTLLLGLDGRPAPGKEGQKKLEQAYNDPSGYTKAFEEHGWEVVRRELGLVDDPGVEFVGRYNEIPGRHEAYLKSKAHQTLHLPLSDKDVTLQEGELLHIEWSYKYSFAEALDLFKAANLRLVDSWKAPHSEYRLYVLERPIIQFESPTINNNMTVPIQTKVGLENVKNLPKWEEWLALWKLWDHITLQMIPREMLHTKPIDLRHICLFYIGHIPTFLDIHLTNMTNGSHTEPAFFKDIFERGIDPDVDDPCKVHAHSQVPVEEADWPTLDDILAFRDRVRKRLWGIYEQMSSGELQMSRHIARVIFMTYEHEALHAETLLYMLLQSSSTRPPTATAQPEWEHLVVRWKAEAVPNRVLNVSGGTIQLGHDDVEGQDSAFTTQKSWTNHELGWDNESPAVSHQVNAFKVDALPISNADYLAYLKSKTNIDWDDCCALPASWVKVNGEWKVRTLYGPVSFEIAGQWPLMASKLEVEAYAKSKGGRLPTEPELRHLWEQEEGPRPTGVLANAGFRNWHPTPPTSTQTDNAGKVLPGHNGGVWEWTSSEFEGHKGFEASDLYPGYSADFFDGKHFVVLGGSFATVPSIAGRRSFRNWYQANYRFSFIGGRVAYDA